MAIIASEKNSSSFEPISEGLHAAVCVWVIDIGDQWSDQYQKSSRKVMLTWEVPDETITVDGEEKPRVISKEYTMSLSEKAVLRQHLESWRGKKFSEEERAGFDLINVLGKSCQIQVLHNDKGYANIGSIVSYPRGVEPLTPYNDTIYFDLTDKASLSLLDKIPTWIQDKIKQSPTYKQLVDSSVDSDTGDFQEIEDSSDLPF